MSNSKLTKQRDELAEAYGANSRHLKTSQHFIDGFNALYSHLLNSGAQEFSQSAIEDSWAKAWYAHLESPDVNDPLVKSHFYKAFREGARWQHTQSAATIAAIKSKLAAAESTLEEYNANLTKVPQSSVERDKVKRIMDLETKLADRDAEIERLNKYTIAGHEQVYEELKSELTTATEALFTISDVTSAFDGKRTVSFMDYELRIIAREALAKIGEVAT